MRPIIASSVAILLAACAATPGANTYQAEYAELQAGCHADGGVLVPTGGPRTGHPQTEYACQFQDTDATQR